MNSQIGMSDLASYLKNLQTAIGGATVSLAPPTPNSNGTTVSTSGVSTSVSAPTPVTVPTTSKKLKFMLVSTHISQVTGYSKVSYGILKELAKIPWLEVIHFGFQKYKGNNAVERHYPAGVREIDAATMDPQNQQMGFAFTGLPEMIQEVKPHVVMVYNDMSIVANFMEAIKKAGIERTFQAWVYIDQVYTSQTLAHIDVLNREADRIFTFTKYWRDTLKSQGVHRPIDVLAHGFDSDIFRKVERDVARKALGLPADMFLLTSFNRNQPRKRLDLLIMAFVELLVKFPSKKVGLLCVCDKGEKGGWPLFEIYVRELRARGVRPEMYGDRLIITQRDMTYTDEEINMLYNAGDVGVSAAEGEGWGLCTFEQMGLGVPQVAPDVGGYKEYCAADCSYLVKPKSRYYYTMAQSPVGGEAWLCDPHDLCLAMENYVLDSELRGQHGKAGAARVATYTWAEAVKTLVRRLEHTRDDVEADSR